MSREGKLAKNTLILSIGTFLPKLASIITLPILTGCLTRSEMGTYDVILILESLFLPTATFQIQTAAFRFLIDARDDEEKVKEIMTTIMVFAIPISLAALTVLYLCLGKIDSTVRILVCLYFFIDSIVNILLQMCRGINENMVYSISAILSSVGKMIFAVICVYWLRAGLKGTVIALLMSVVFALVFLVFKAKIYRYIDLRCFSRNKLREMLRYSWPMVPNCMSSWVMRVSDRFVVILFMGIEANAVYVVANKIPGLLSIAQNTFTMAWQENASVVSRDRDASEYYSSMFRTMFDLMAGFFGLLIAATPVLFKLLIRGDYAAAYNQIPILFVGMFFFSMSTFLGGIYVAYMESKSVGITTTAAAACNLIVDIATIRWIGLYAASGSTLISYLFLFIFRSIDVQRIVKVRYSLTHMLVILAIMVSESVMCFMQKPVLNVINLVLGCVVFVVINKSFVKAVMKKGMAYINKKRAAAGSSAVAVTEAAGSTGDPGDAEAAGAVKAAGSTGDPGDAEAAGSTGDAATPAPSDIPALAENKSSCCGCSACYAACPVGAIEMKADEEGFLYPVIDPDKCVRCHKCLQACAFKRDLEGGSHPEDTLVYACRTRDREILERSSSGGAFVAISDVFLERGDAVLCSHYNYEEHRTEFALVLTKEDRDASSRSMYMQSYALDAWKEALKWMKDNPERRLLYTGLGCQAAGFMQFMKMNSMSDRVFIVDIVCHGAPSPKIWAEYARSLEKGGKLSDLNFKNKKTGWSKSVGTVCVDGEEISIAKYRRIYTDRYTIRQSCFSCPYTRMNRDTDITIGDFWHMEKSMPDFVDEMGTSLVLIHTERGKELFDAIKEKLDYRESNTTDCWQLNLQEPTKPSGIRGKFWRDYRKHGIDYVMDHYGVVPLWLKAGRKIRGLFK